MYAGGGVKTTPAQENTFTIILFSCLLHLQILFKTSLMIIQKR